MAESGEYFGQSQLWGRPPEAYQRRVCQDICALVGGRAASILDVGCGDGIITNALAESARVVGVDTSAEALQHVRRTTVKASATDLPFADGEFDLVMANDLLEHLGDEELHQAVAEMRRVARRWVLVTVPFMEILESGRTRCGKCGTLYHVNHHQRALGVRELRRLVPGLVPALMVFSGAAVDPVEAAQRRLRSRFGILNHWDLAVCPECGARASMGSPAELTAAVDAAARDFSALSGGASVDRSECIAVYSLDGSPLAPLPAPSRDSGPYPTPSLLAVRGGQLVELPSVFALSAGNRVLSPDGPGDGGDARYVRQPSASTDYLYAVGEAPAGKPVVIPEWFNGRELPEISPARGPDWDPIAEFQLLATHAATARKEGLLQSLQAEGAALRQRLAAFEALQVRADNLAAQNQSQLIRLGQMEALQVDLQNLRAENESLRRAGAREEMLKVDLQNVRAENHLLKIADGRRQQLEIELQNLHQENDALKLGQGRMNQLLVDLQNQRAENDALKLTQGRMDQALVDLQNLRAENDALKLAQGRMNQLLVDLQNLRAENDALKLAQGGMNQVSLDLQNVRAENDELKLRAQRRDPLEADQQHPHADARVHGTAT